MIENFLKLVDIEEIEKTEEYVNMVDIAIDEDESFLLSNGITSHNSAVSAFRKYRDSQKMGAFALRGKFVNVTNMSNMKLIKNKEAVNLMAAIGLEIGKKINKNKLRYDKIYLYVDADCLESNTKVYTKNGFVKICDLTYDDLILTHSGEYRKVNRIVKKDISKFYEVSINGETIVCTDKHKHIIYRDGEVKEIRTKDIKKEDKFLIKKGDIFNEEIKLDDYSLHKLESIKQEEGIGEFYDIEVDKDHSFYIKNGEELLLTHNCDGNSIASLLLNFFYKYWPEMFDMGMVYKVETPIVVAEPRKKTKGKKTKKFFYNQKDYTNWLKKAKTKNYDIKYKKGLAALVGDEYDAIINDPMLTKITNDGKSSDSLYTWFGKESSLRKDELLD